MGEDSQCVKTGEITQQSLFQLCFVVLLYYKRYLIFCRLIKNIISGICNKLLYVTYL